MSWTDKELDELFKDAAAGQSFEYNAAYFKDIEAQLPVNRVKKRGFFWLWWSASLVLIAVSTLLFVQNNERNDNRLAQPKNDQNISKGALKNDAGGSFKHKTIGNPSFAQIEEEKANDNSVVSNHLFESKDRTTLLGEIMKSELNTERITVEKPDLSQGSIQSLDVGTLDMIELQSEGSVFPEMISHQFVNPQSLKRRSKLYFEFAGGMGQSPVSSVENGSARSLNWSLSGGYIYSKSNWSVSAGAGVGEQYFENLYIKERSTIYGFGVNTFDNHYQFTSLFKLDLPLNFSYRFGSHELNAGLNTAIPLFTRVSFVEIKDGLENKNGKSYSTTSPYFRKVFVEPSIGYRFELDRNWSIGASLKTLLFNPLDSDRIKGDRNKLPLSGQITLRRTFELR